MAEILRSLMRQKERMTYVIFVIGRRRRGKKERGEEAREREIKDNHRIAIP